MPPKTSSHFPPRPARRAAFVQRGRGGFTLVELMISFAVLAITVTGTMYGFMFLNNFAAASRNQSSAKALCQQRIEQALTLPFHPPATLPCIDGFYLLGQASDWTTASPPYNAASPAGYTHGSASVQTSSESVNVYVEQDGATARVTGTRTTTLACSNTALNLAQFTVRVAYTFRSKDYAYEMYLLRSPD